MAGANGDGGEAAMVFDANSFDTVKLWRPSVVCKWVVSSGLPQEIGEHFVEHSINGELLLRLQFDDMAQLGVINVGDEFALWERIEVLQRYCKKPNTRVLEVPSYFARLVKTATFAFADTSEGKSTEDMKTEVVQAHCNVAIVSTLVWAIAWDIFYNSAYDTFCFENSKDPSVESMCVTSGGYDLEGRTLVIFYCFSGLCAISLLFSTIFAVVQIIMVYEMSDEVELEIFLDLLGSRVQLPGIFLFLGIALLACPIVVFMVFNGLHGVYFQTLYYINDDPKHDMANLVLSYFAEGGTTLLVICCVGYFVPVFVGDLYSSKVKAMQADVEMVNNNFKDLDLGDAHF